MILYLVSADGFWLGGTNLTVAGSLEWATGSCEWSFEDWGRHYGGGHDQRCLAIADSWGWNDQTCSHANGFICQFN